MRILLGHQSDVLVLQLVRHDNTLGSVAKLDQGLEDAATIMLEAELVPFFADLVNALLDESVFIIAGHLPSLHQQFIVRNLSNTGRVVRRANNTYDDLL